MLKIFDNEKKLALAVFEEMKNQLRDEINPVFCLASGGTPKKIYSIFSNECEDDKNLDKLKIVSLDEWINVSSNVVGSCFQMLEADLFSYLNLPRENIVFYKTVDTNLNAECNRIDSFIKENPITFSLMGVGMNGHIGLNEPGDEIKNNSSVVNLSNTTKTVLSKYFEKQMNIDRGITLGLKQIIDAKRVIVVITGEHKKEIVKEIFENENAQLPAQVLLSYEHIDFYIDKSAASLLSNVKKEVL